MYCAIHARRPLQLSQTTVPMVPRSTVVQQGQVWKAPWVRILAPKATGTFRCCSACVPFVPGLVREMIIRLKRIEGTSKELRKNKYECIPLKRNEGTKIKIRIPVANVAKVKSEPPNLKPDDFICNKTLPFKRQRQNKGSRKWKALHKILAEEQKLMLPSTAAICGCLHICFKQCYWTKLNYPCLCKYKCIHLRMPVQMH